MTRIRFEDLPSRKTPKNAENLNKLNNVIISSTEPTTGEEVWLKKTTNIFKEIWENGCLNSSNGTDEANSGRIRTYYIEVLPNTTYSLSLVAARLVEYNQNGGFVKSHFGISKLTTNSNTKYIRFSITSTDAHDEVMVTEGNEVLPYEKYVEPAIYTRNDNEIYEEFIPTNIQKYSTREPIKIGKWINGKDLYIHTVYIPSLPNASTGFYDLGIDKSIIDEVWIDESNSYFKAASTDGANTEVFPMNYTYSSTNYLMTNIRNKQIRIITTDNKSGTYGYITYKFTRNDE